jgi:hypothetical protein
MTPQAFLCLSRQRETKYLPETRNGFMYGGHKASDNFSLYFFGKQSLLDYLSDICGENMGKYGKKPLCMCAKGLKRLAQDG